MQESDLPPISGTNSIELMSWTWQNLLDQVETSSSTQLNLTNLLATLLSMQF